MSTPTCAGDARLCDGHHFVFVVRNGDICYERTSNHAGAVQRVAELVARGLEAFWSLTLPARWFY